MFIAISSSCQCLRVHASRKGLWQVLLYYVVITAAVNIQTSNCCKIVYIVTILFGAGHDQRSVIFYGNPAHVKLTAPDRAEKSLPSSDTQYSAVDKIYPARLTLVMGSLVQKGKLVPHLCFSFHSLNKAPGK